jgi:hypothetical protein
LNGPDPMTVECHTAFDDPGASALDACAGPLTVTTTGAVDPNAPGTYLLTYTATDGYNTATTNRTIHVVDTTPPTITFYFTSLPLATSTTNCQAVLPDLTGPAFITALDNGGSVTVTQVPPAGSVLPLGTNLVVLSAIDAWENSSSVTSAVVVADLTAPVLTLLGSNPLTNECHGPFADPGVSATDNCSGSVLITNSTVNSDQPGAYTIQYVATDPAGNSSANSRLVYIVDTQPPVLTLNGPDPMTVECHTAFDDPGASALDACAGPLTVTTTGAVDPNAPGTYLLTYTATDGYNTATTNRTVHVLDTTPPAISWHFTSLTLAASITNCQAVLPDLTGPAYWVASDNCSPTISSSQSPPAGTILPLGPTNILINVDDGNGNTNSFIAIVSVEDQNFPVIIAAPQSQTNRLGDDALFTVTASACTPLAYQWFFEGQPISGRTDSTLLLNRITSADAGQYSVAIIANGGSVTSAVALLTVTIPEPVSPVIDSQLILPSGAFQLTFSGPNGQTFKVLATTDLALLPQYWTILTNGAFAGAPATFVDHSAPDHPHRFYRLVSP